MRSLTLSLALLLTMLTYPLEAKAENRFITIGTGGITGVYYPAGGAICRLVNRNRIEHGMRCSVESTGGSIHNLNAIAQSDLDFGIAQSDLHYNAVKGKGVFTEFGSDAKLRSVFSLHSEPFTVVARADSKIKKFDDLKGKRVNIGNLGSGMRSMMEQLMTIKHWNNQSFAKLSELKTHEQAKALCDNKVDAIIFTAGHPNGSIHEVTTTCEAKIIPVEGPEIDKLIAENPYYAYAVIPGKMYKGTDHDVKTFGVKATLVTSADVPEEVVYQVTKAVFDNFDSFKTLHFVFATLDKNTMLRDGLTAPMHEGAKKYFKEVGMAE